MPHPVDLLVDDGLLLTNVALGRMQHEIALGVDLELVHASKAKHDLFRVRPGSDHEIVFELALVAVVEKVDPGIDVLVVDLCIGRDVGAPRGGIFADEVVCFAGEFVEPAHERLGRGTYETHPQRGRLHLRLCIGPRRRAVPVAFCIRIRR